MKNENDMQFDSLSCCFAVRGAIARAQDLSKYRHFTLGMSLTKVLERTGTKGGRCKGGSRAFQR